MENLLAFLGPNVPLDRNFFRIPRFFGICCGFWPQSQRSWFTVVRFAFALVLVAAGGLVEMSYALINLTNLVKSLEAFCPGMTKVVCFLKISMFFRYRRQWHGITQRMHRKLLEDKDPAKRMEAQKLAGLATFFSFLLMSSGCSTNAFFNIRPLLTMAYRHWYGLEYERTLPFLIPKSELFLDFPIYPIVYLLLFLSGLSTCFIFSGIDGFFICGCSYISGLYTMLEYDIRKIFDEVKTSDYASLRENLKIRQQLGGIVVRHNSIIDLCMDFRSQFTLIILGHFLSAALVLCSSILNMLLNQGASVGLVLYLFYSVAALTQLFLYCIGGNLVSENSQRVSVTLYNIEWYKCDVKTRKMILMMMRRSQKAEMISVPFFTPSLPAFTMILKTAGSYITMFKTLL